MATLSKRDFSMPLVGNRGVLVAALGAALLCGCRGPVSARSITIRAHHGAVASLPVPPAQAAVAATHRRAHAVGTVVRP